MNRSSLRLFSGIAALVLLVGCGDGEQGTGKAVAGGSPGVGGSNRTGGSTGVGGGPAAGGAAQGGSETGGGGRAVGGTGGKATGGTAGGTPSGGSSASGGVGGIGGGVPGACIASIVAPTDGAKLDETDDLDGDRCANGFQYDVVVATSAPNGTSVALYAGTSTKAMAQATVSNAQARFSSVALSSNATTELRILVSAATACEATASVAVECAGVPTCTISAPAVSDTHPALNGVPVANGGDRVSSTGSPYQAAFEVATNIGNGQLVLLSTGSGNSLSAGANNGKASFPGVTLVPDGTYDVAATCIAANQAQSQSPTLHLEVDTAPPALSGFKVKSGNVVSALQAGDHFDSADDSSTADGLDFRICGTTTSTDALDLPASLGAGQQNLCVAVGTSSPVCAAATTAGAAGAGSGNGACVNVGCPGMGAFDLTMTLRDRAGNPTTTTVTGVTCSSELPQVQFVDPVGDEAPWTDVSKRVLAASAGAAQRKDKDAATAGAQYDVVACTNATGGSAQLFAGLQGGPLPSIATTVLSADTAGRCPPGLANVVQFLNVTLPESLEGQDFQLQTPTALRVEVVDQSGGRGSGDVVVWVDSTTPVLSVLSPAGLCNMRYTGTTDVTTNVRLAASLVPVTMTVGTTSYTGTTLSYGTVTIPNVVFPLGTSNVAASVEEPSGNTGQLPPTCQVMVGNIPTVTWVTPVSSSKLAAATSTGTNIVADADGTLPGWQGQLRVCTSIDVTDNPAATVQFTSSADGAIGAPVPLDSSGCAAIASATVSEGNPVLLVASTSPVGGLVGEATLTLPVDVTVPGAPTEILGSVKDRRQTTLHLAWTAPADGAVAAQGYDVRVARGSSAVIDTTAKFDAAERVIYGGTPGAPGSADGVDVRDRIIENDYFFAIRTTDAAGNTSPIAYTSAATRAQFNTTQILSTVTNERLGYWLDGSSDLNGDGLSDLVLGTYGALNAYVYFGSASGYPPTPSVTLASSVAAFGQSVNVVGDVNGDGLTDLAISSLFDGDGKVYLYYGRTTWPRNLDSTQADAVIESNSATDAKFAAAAFGMSVGALGDFDGDGVDDFAIGAPYYGGTQGHVTVIYGSRTGLPRTVTVPADYGTRALGIVGDATGNLGSLVLGLPGFYPGGSTLIATAPYASANGSVYAWSGHGPSSRPLFLSSATQNYAASEGGRLGIFSGATLRDAPGLSLPAVVFGVPAASSGAVRAWTGTSSTGPLGQLIANLNDAGATVSNSFGRYVVTGGFSGSRATASLIGDTTPDMAMGSISRTDVAARVFIVDGDKLPTLGFTGADISSVAEVIVALPAGWVDFGGHATSVRDSNGDGYADLAVSEMDWRINPFNGRVIILW